MNVVCHMWSLKWVTTHNCCEWLPPSLWIGTWNPERIPSLIGSGYKNLMWSGSFVPYFLLNNLLLLIIIYSSCVNMRYARSEIGLLCGGAQTPKWWKLTQDKNCELHMIFCLVNLTNPLHHLLIVIFTDICCINRARVYMLKKGYIWRMIPNIHAHQNTGICMNIDIWLKPFSTE